MTSTLTYFRGNFQQMKMKYVISKCQDTFEKQNEYISLLLQTIMDSTGQDCGIRYA